ncbi:MAG: signal transduction histidine kinase/CheY-like chemotaxis protein [Arenicella sp.]|jgi:signal transduction histidine kinase/CheY-like chemotaxis protein/HPt (histidine-containing phosphotransfer) domain-containing protein
MKIIKLIALFVSVFSCGVSSLYAQSPIQINEGESISIGQNIEYLIDTTESLGINDLSDKTFTPCETDILNLGNTLFPVWMKFTVSSETEEIIFLQIAASLLNELDVYRMDESPVKIFSGGAGVGFDERPISAENWLIELELNDSLASTYYIRGQSFYPFQIPINLSANDKLIESNQLHYLFWGLYLGIMIFAFVYNLFIYISVRDRSYLYYLIYIACSTLFYLGLEGFGFQFIWPNIPEINPIVPVLVSITNIAITLFTLRFLGITKKQKKLYYIAYAVIWVNAVIAVINVAGFFVEALMLSQMFSLLACIYFIITGVISLKKGVPNAKYFLVAWVTFTLMVITYILALNNVIPSNFFTTHGIYIGHITEVLLFSFALADRINLLQRKNIFQLEENRELALKVNKELEQKVSERTKELAIEKEEADRQRKKAEESEAFKQEFLANMSHEIRTPMNAVMGMTNLVLDTELKDKQKSYLEKVKKSSDNLLHIINDILDLSKIEAGKMELEEIDMSMVDTVDQVKNTLMHKAEEKGLELLVKIDREIDEIVIGDPVRLNQVLINLTGNAIKFTEKGSVAINLKKHGDKIRFSIVDTGIGIAEDKIKTVFESFGQANTSDTRKYGGTGLGLSISQQLVNLMDSTIEIESEVGKGTNFFFDIDLKVGDRDRYEERIAGSENVDGTILDGLKILIADDNEYNRIVARDTIQSKANVTIIEAENGQEVLDKLTEDVDIILMDVQMPIMSGLDATTNIRKLENKKLQNVPVVALTASVLRTDLDKCIDAGMNGYIPKPFKAQELIAGIAKALKIKLKLNKKVKKEQPKKAVTDASSEKITDLTYLTEFCDADKDKMQKYVDMFLKTAPNFLTDLEALMNAKDGEGIANHVHGFNTKFVMMGMNETKSLSIAIENELREDGDLTDINKKIQLQVEILAKNVTTAIEELA